VNRRSATARGAGRKTRWCGTTMQAHDCRRDAADPMSGLMTWVTPPTRRRVRQRRRFPGEMPIEQAGVPAGAHNDLAGIRRGWLGPKDPVGSGSRLRSVRLGTRRGERP
jgi:hypothetical protein